MKAVSMYSPYGWRAKIGLINSLGERRDVASVDSLVGLLSGDAAVVEAAGAALGKIGDELLVDAWIKIKIEALQCLVAAEAGTTQTQVVLLLFTAPGFVLDDQGEELWVGELFLDCLPITCVEAIK